jgi:hypothetical protein
MQVEAAFVRNRPPNPTYRSDSPMMMTMTNAQFLRNFNRRAAIPLKKFAMMSKIARSVASLDAIHQLT